MNNKVPIVAIVGRANVGKSSLFNALLGKRNAIVADEPGTTRDSITAKASCQGKDFWLVDTAGLKSPADDFELTIQEQISEAAAAADLIAITVEADVPITEEDRRLATMSLKTKKPVILIINKIDKYRRAQLEDWQRLGIKQGIATSATQKTGITELLELITDQLPAATIKDTPFISVSFIGRPNVGKSSLFNALAKKQQAIVADKAGTTRDVNHAYIRYRQKTIRLADTAGIRRQGRIERGVEHFSVLRALAAIEQSDICLLLIDSGELDVQLDQKIAGLVKDAGKGLILVVSKWDKLDKDAYTHNKITSLIAANFAFVPWAPLIFTSAINDQNVSKLYELLLDIYIARHQKILTPELNRWLRQAVSTHPPAGLKNRAPKLNYVVQEDDQDWPNFKIFGAHTKFLHWSYKRYLDRKFRETWPLAGTPLKFWFIEKH